MSSKLIFSVFLNSYSDLHASNAPSLSNVKWNRELDSIPCANPTSQAAQLAPGENLVLFDGTRTLSQDGTTRYSIALKQYTTNTYVLSGVSGTLPNFRTPRVTGADATSQVSVTINGPVATFSGPSIGIVAAFFTGTIGGMATSVTITANNPGTTGNSIVITPNGTSTVSELIATWNTNNPLATVTLTSGDGTQIPTGGNFSLSGGANSTALNLIFGGVVVGDYVTIGSNFNQLNQGTYQIIALTATSFSIENLLAVPEGPIALGSGFATQLQIFGAAGVQIGDTLVISGGFSPATWGSYKVTAVYANSLEFYSNGPLPQESSILTEAIAIYSNAKQLIYIESDSIVSMTMNNVVIGNIEPFIINTNVRPGVFLLKSTVFSLSLQNNGLNAANIFFASVE